MFNPSPYNLAIQEYWQTYQQKNLMVDAVAGSGKTTQIFELCKLAPNKRKLYLVFSKEMQTEVEPKLASTSTDVMTFHSFGLKAIRNAGNRCRVDQWKYHNIFDQYGYDDQKYGITKNQAIKTLQIIRDWYVEIDPDGVLDALEHWDIEVQDEFWDEHVNEFCEFLKFVDQQGIQDLSNVDFSDMIYAPLRLNLKFPQYDEVFVDEVQDLNTSKQLTLLRIKNARLTCVGDPYQAIFGFTGADTKAFWNLQDRLNAKVFPLSKCYRCPDEVLELAQEYVPHIEGTGKTGIINQWDRFDVFEKLKPGNLVICRRNAPLVSLALQLMAKKKPCKIKGREFSEFVIKLVEETEKKRISFSDLAIEIDNLINKKIEKITNEGKIRNLLDAADCIKAISEECDSYPQFKADIRSLFADKVDGDFIHLCSFHRSKGLERDSVTILLDRPLSKPGNGQESNLAYVAITRAKQELNFLKW